MPPIPYAATTGAGAAGSSSAAAVVSFGSPLALVLAERLYQGMVAAWQATQRQPLRRMIAYRFMVSSIGSV